MGGCSWKDLGGGGVLLHGCFRFKACSLSFVCGTSTVLYTKFCMVSLPFACLEET